MIPTLKRWVVGFENEKASSAGSACSRAYLTVRISCVFVSVHGVDVSASGVRWGVSGGGEHGDVADTTETVEIVAWWRAVGTVQFI